MTRSRCRVATAIVLLASVQMWDGQAAERAGGGPAVVADAYGTGDGPGVVLAPGAVFDRASWRPLAEHLAGAGFRVLAIDYTRPDRSAPPPAPAEDVEAAVRRLHAEGVARVAVVGGSMGATAASRAAVVAPGSIDRLVLLSPGAIEQPERVGGRKLVVASADEPGIDRIRAAYARLAEPKRLLVFTGTAHAQHVFATDRAEQLRDAITAFLREP